MKVTKVRHWFFEEVLAFTACVVIFLGGMMAGYGWTLHHLPPSEPVRITATYGLDNEQHYMMVVEGNVIAVAEDKGYCKSHACPFPDVTPPKPHHRRAKRKANLSQYYWYIIGSPASEGIKPLPADFCQKLDCPADLVIRGKPGPNDEGREECWIGKDQLYTSNCKRLKYLLSRPHESRCEPHGECVQP